jgi:phenylacetate-CoA ligase
MEPFFHLRSAPGTVWPTVPVPEVSQIWAAYQQLDRSQWMNPAQLADLQLNQLRILVRHCYQQVPYYRRLLADCGLSTSSLPSITEYRRLPLLTRELYQANSSDLQARTLPTGMTPAGSAFTSGTHGVPIKVLGTNWVGLWWNAFYLRDLEWSGMDPRGRLASIRVHPTPSEGLKVLLEGRSLPSWGQALDALVETGPSYMMDVRQDPRHQLEWLRAVSPHYLQSMPSNLELLASLLPESGGRLPELRVIQSLGETLPESTRHAIEAAFGVPVKNLYSSTKAGYMASPCPSGHGLHVHSENILAEVLDTAGNPCAPGETGRLVLTTLHNYLTPFLRYDILDDVTLGPGPCPCGRGLPLWTRVEGQRRPFLVLRDGRRKTSMGMTLRIRQAGGCHQFQIIQRGLDHVVLRVVPDTTWSPDRAARMRRIVDEEMEGPIRVDIEEKPYLDRPPGGKLKVVVVELEEGNSRS